MEYDTWISGYKVRIFPWVDGENIYVNVQYFLPGSSLYKPPAFDKSVLIKDDDAGRRFVYEFMHTCVEYVARLQIPAGGMAHIEVG